jgi:hypothetical protein
LRRTNSRCQRRSVCGVTTIPWRRRGKQSAERRKQSTIGWPQRGPRLLPAQHDELMSLHEQLDVFNELAAPAFDQQPQHSREGG